MNAQHRAHQLDAPGRLLLAAAIGERPESLMTLEQLRRGLCTATIVGSPEAPLAAVIQPDAFPGDANVYGDDPDLLWSVLQSLPGWESIEASTTLAPALAARMCSATGRPCQLDEEIFSTLARPVARQLVPAARRLTPADLPLMEAATDPLRMGDWRFGSAAALLTEGFAAGAIIKGELVAVGFTAARGARYADVGIATREDWRNRGLSTAAAALVCADIQAAGLTPVWGTGTDNLASQRVAAKLGFREVSRRVYVNMN
jgi:RimJ/RimL family protein N-acetyltransferase